MKLKRWMIRAIAFTLFLILTVSGFAAENRLAVNIKTLAGNVIQQFGGVELRVAAVRDDKVYLNAGRNKFISEGAIYQIIVDGLPFNDPVSRRRLGNIEIVVADVQIITVRNNYSIAQVLDHSTGEMDLATGQRAIPQRSKISIAIIPFEYLNSFDETTPRIAQEIIAAELINSGLFVVAGAAKAKEAAELLQPESPGTVQFSKSIGRMLGVEYVLYGFIIDSPGYMEIQCRVHSGSEGTGVAAATIRIESEFSDPQQ